MNTAEEIGRGTFGTVYSGINVETEECVAVKVCNADDKARLEAARKEIENMNSQELDELTSTSSEEGNDHQ